MRARRAGPKSARRAAQEGGNVTAYAATAGVRIGALSGDVRKLRRLQAAAAADQRKALAIVQVRREYYYYYYYFAVLGGLRG